MIDAIQRVALQIGRYGCYFLCLLKLSENFGFNQDVFYWYTVAENAKWMGEDPTLPGQRCFVFKPEELLGSLLGKRMSLRKEGPLYVAKPGELEILRKEIPGISGHFVLPDWDPMGESNTGTNGVVVSKRIFMEVI
jgi:hypothetical protein